MEASLARGLARAARAMAHQPDLQATLDTVCAEAVAAVGADACSIFLLRKGTVHTAAVSTPELRAAEEAQVAAGEGPCLDVVRQRRVVDVPDLRTERRWPRWAPRMVELGWLSVLSVPLVERDRTVGSLNFVSRAAGGLGEPAADVGRLFAEHASLALTAARTEYSLVEAVGTRHAVGLAQGILMERYGLDVDRAFEAMRRCSQEGNVKLRSVAEHVVRDRRLPGGDAAVRG
ncbi:GAF domain-containing protein [Friedmanniella luteola]|uniref:GAF domain-containing protein n=1 Tax=Friedmanniella luteola TaxID=546871 RepID=A0A1H1VGN1_9ACTN|nr:GAF and ANTAR domain-containing protein [Friedmanniella luteola]SDS83893.1 GAF domain-containing protein [Friedmanniella luteola]